MNKIKININTFNDCLRINNIFKIHDFFINELNIVNSFTGNII